MELKISDVILIITICCVIVGQSVTTKDAIESQSSVQEENTCFEGDDNDKSMKVAQKRIQKIYKACGEVCKIEMKDERRFLDPKVSRPEIFSDTFKKPKKGENILFQRTKFYKGLIKPIDCEVMKWGSKASPLFDMTSGFCKPPKTVPKKSLLDFVYGKVPSMYSN